MGNEAEEFERRRARVAELVEFVRRDQYRRARPQRMFDGAFEDHAGTFEDIDFVFVAVRVVRRARPRKSASKNSARRLRD
jgi:hypothetical protein